MPDFRIGEALKRVERAAAGQQNPPEPDMPVQPSTTAQVEAVPDSIRAEPGPDNVDTYPESLRPLLEYRAAEYGDGARWEALLHNAWQLGRECPDQSLFWTFITFRAGGCQLVPHADGGWAIRFDANKAATLRSQDEAGLLFASPEAYTVFAGKYLAPVKQQLTELLRLSSLGVLEEQGDMSWAWVDADRRKAAAKGGGRSA